MVHLKFSYIMKKLLLLFLSVLLCALHSDAQTFTAPYTQDFTGTTIPAGWSTYHLVGTQTSWRFSGAGNTATASGGCTNPLDHTTGVGNNFAWYDWSNTATNVGVLEMPAINVGALTTPELIFYYFMCGGTNPTNYPTPNILEVEAWDGSAWIGVDTLTNSTPTWEEKKYLLSSFTYSSGDSVRIRFITKSGGSTFDFLGDPRLDDITVQEAPTCIAPSNLNAGSIGTDTAIVSWMDNNTTPPGNGWEIELGAQGFSPTGTPSLSAPTNPFVLTSLIPNTAYDYYVRARCSATDSSFWTGPYSFTTFATCILPSGLNAYNVTTSDAQLTWTDNNFSPPALGWQVAIAAAGGGVGASITGMSANDTVSASTVAGFSLPPNTPFEFFVRAVCAVGDSTAWVGPFPFTTLPTCLPPDTLNATNLTGLTADLSWVDMAASPPMGWQIINQLTTGPVAGDTTYQVGATPTSITVTGLTPNNTNYQFYVRAVCAAGDSSAWAGPFNYTTPCIPIAAPYCENFETGNNCWSQETVTDDFNWTRDANGTTSSATGPSSGANGTTWYMYTETSSPITPGDTAIFYSPEIDLTALTTPQLNFWLHMYGAGMNPDGGVIVDVTTVGSGTWSNVLTVIGNQGNVWTNHVIPIPSVAGDTVQFRIIGAVSTNPPTFVYENDFAFDEFCIEEATTCFVPDTLNATNITANSVDLSWVDTAGVAIQGWEIINQLTSGPVAGDTTYQAGATPSSISLSSLIPLSNYEFYVRAVCGPGDTSAWAGPYAYATPASCFAPDTLNASNIMATSADLSWVDTAGVAVQGWEIINQLTSGPVAGDTTYQAGAMPMSITISTLMPLSNYEFYVRAVCGPGDTSVWAGPFAYATPPTCIAPDTLDAQNITATSADLSWVDMAAAPPMGWEIINQLTSGPVAGDTTYQAGATPTSISMTSLIPNSNYAFYVRAVCTAGDSSFWTGPYFYTTPPTCVAPDTLNATNIMATSADLSWVDMTPVPPMGWEIINQLTSGPVAGDTTYQAGATPTSISMASLTPNSNYQFFVRAVCTAGDSSAWAGPYNYTTPPTCIAPDTLNAINLTGPTADLTWVDMAASPPMGWQIINQLATGPVAGDTTYQAGAAPTLFAATGLTDLTDYQFYVRAVCTPGDSSAWAGPFNYTTPLSALNCGTGTASANLLFEEFFHTGGAQVALTPAVTSAGWSQFRTATRWWRMESNGTNSGGGASAGANGSSGYVYFEASGGSNANVDTLYSPPIDLSVVTGGAARLTFYYHMFGGSIGTLNVLVDDGTTKTSVFTLSGGQQTSQASPWTQVSVDLSSYIGQTINLNFTASALGCCPGDLGIDEVTVEGCVPQVIDMRADSVVAPVLTAGCFTNSESVAVNISNNALTPIDFSVDTCIVAVDVAGPIPTTIMDTLSSGTLAAGASQTVNMTMPIDLSTAGVYNLTAYTVTMGDVDLSNDTMSTPAAYTAGLAALAINASEDTLCLSGNSFLTATGGNGATLQWEESSTATGPWSPVGTGTDTFTTPTISTTTYYRVVGTCGANTDSTVQEIFVNNPTVGSTTNDTICGPNSATLIATGSTPTTVINWYDMMSGGSLLSIGDTLFTPVISATDTFYAEPSTGGVGGLTHTPSLAGGNGQSFVMFPLQASIGLEVDSFQANIDAGTWDVSIYYMPMNYQTVAGSVTNLAPWTFVGSSTGVVSTAQNVPTNIGIPVNISIPAGQTYSFIITITNGTSQNYTNGTTLGAVWSSNADMAVLEGHGGAWPLGGLNFNPRNMNGIIHYTTGCGAASRTPVYAVVNPSSGDLALTTSSNATSTPGLDSLDDLHGDGQNLSYYNPTCELIATIDDAAGGNVLGMVTSKVNVDATVNVVNGQPYVRRWYEITPASNGPADVTLYFTQADFDDYNAHPNVIASVWDSLPSGPTASTALVRITKLDGGGIGVGTTSIITPNSVTWDATNARWVVNFPVTGFSQFFLHAGQNPLNPLPVSLTKFTVTKEGSVSFAAWVTESEQNNSHFNLQRSLDGNAFTTLGRVNTKAMNGTSTTELNYNFTDRAPQVGHNYYRLEQVDRDGNLSYSEIIDVVWGANGSIVSIYPNPATDKLNVDVSTDKVSQLEVRLLDMSGRVVKSVMRQTDKGMNNVTLDLDNIASGVYGVQILENNALIHTSKVNKRSK